MTCDPSFTYRTRRRRAALRVRVTWANDPAQRSDLADLDASIDYLVECGIRALQTLQERARATRASDLATYDRRLRVLEEKRR